MTRFTGWIVRLSSSSLEIMIDVSGDVWFTRVVLFKETWLSSLQLYASSNSNESCLRKSIDSSWSDGFIWASGTFSVSFTLDDNPVKMKTVSTG